MRRVVWLGLGVLVVALVAGGVAMAARKKRPRKPPAGKAATVTFEQLGQWKDKGYDGRLAFAPDGRRWAAGSSMAVTMFRDAAVEQHVATRSAPGGLGFSDGGKQLHVGPFTHDAATGKALDTGDLDASMVAGLGAVSPRSVAVERAAASPDGAEVVLALRSVPARREGAKKVTVPNRLLVLKARTFELVGVLRDGGGPFVRLAVDARHIAGVSGQQILVWDRTTRAPRAELKKQLGELGDLAFSPDGKYLATISAGRDHLVVLWDTSTWKAIASWSGDGAGVRALAFHPTRPLLFTGGDDQQVKLWSLPDGKLVQTLPGSARIQGIAVAPTGDRLAIVEGLRSPSQLTLYTLK